MADRITTGYQPGNTQYGAWEQASEDRDFRNRLAAEMALKQQEQDTAQKREEASAQYMKAQADYMRDNLIGSQQARKDAASLKVAQARTEQIQNARPLVAAIQDQLEQAKDPKTGQIVDMGKLYTAAQMHKQLQEQFPEAAKLLGGQPSTFNYRNPTGQVQTVESSLNPDTFGSFAKNWQMDKQTSANNIAQGKNETTLQTHEMDNATKIQIQEMKNKFLQDLQKQKDSAKARTAYQDFKQLNDDVTAGIPGAAERLKQWLTNYQQMRPATVVPTIENGAIVPSPNRPEVNVSTDGAPSVEFVRDPKTGKLIRK